jgi:predicted neuraminidase
MIPRSRLRQRVVGLVAVLAAAQGIARGDENGVIATEFVFEQAPFLSCHASTVAETPAGLVVAWFGGTREGADDVGIWLARRTADGWSPPVEVATGQQEDGRRYPCWNPVLFQARGGPLLLFYKVGPRPSAWWGMLTTSTDAGLKWSPPVRLPEGILGPIKNKPVLLPDGALLCPSSTEDNGWRVHMERTTDLGRTWTRTGPLGDGKTFAAIQPSIRLHSASSLQIVCRSRQGWILQARSADGGATWGPLEATPLPNPNSGIDAVTLADGRAIVIYNHTQKGRSPLNVALSDDGNTWKGGPVLESEPGEYSYPAVIQTADRRIHATYTWKRQRIKHIVLDAATIATRDLP